MRSFAYSFGIIGAVVSAIALHHTNQHVAEGWALLAGVWAACAFLEEGGYLP